MASDQVDRMLSKNSYIFGGVGAVLGGIIGGGVVGFPSAIGAIVVGALLGGILGSYLVKE
jgi:outer membrane lipoprotein SlyB